MKNEKNTISIRKLRSEAKESPRTQQRRLTIIILSVTVKKGEKYPRAPSVQAETIIIHNTERSKC